MSGRWIITVEAVGGTVPAVVRVRKLLKAALRAYGLKAVAVAEVKAVDTTTGKGEAQATNPDDLLKGK